MSMLGAPGSSLDGEPNVVNSLSKEIPDAADRNPGEQDDEDSGGDSDDEEDNTVKGRFEEIKNKLRNKTVDLTDSKKFEEFLREYEVYFGMVVSSDDHSTLLHSLVEDARDKSFDRYEPLVKRWVRSYPELLREKDQSERMVLAWALQKKRNKLVRCICDNHPNIQTIIGIQGLHDRNCLHVAIHEDVTTEVVLHLIAKAGPKAFLAQDDKGNTPLHLAVAYERCTDEALSVVKALIERDDHAVDVQNRSSNKFSPYLYHLHTRAEAEAKACAKKPTERTHGARDADDKQKEKPRLPPVMAPIAGRELSSSAKNRLGTGNHPSKALPQAAVNGETPEPSAASDKTVKIAKEAKTPAENRRSRRTCRGAVGQGADAIGNYLKLHCLRTRSHEQAVELLYRGDRPKDLYFDLYALSSRSINQDWTNGLHYLRFEDTLQYVALSRLEVTGMQSAPSKFSRARSQPLPDGVGRRDMVFIFNFLRRKGVKRILRVIVDDSISPAHSDEAIEEALRGFHVEIWNWRKIDLCTETLVNAALDVREVYLYCSGNNAVLRGWSDRGGLAQLKSLRKVHLHVSQGLETSARTAQNVRQFRERLEALRDNIEIIVTEYRQEKALTQVGNASESAREQVEQRHRWLTCMDGFADFIQNIRISEPLKEDVRVALIDDGVDIEEKSLWGKIIGGRSFCQRDHTQNLQQSFYISGSGHGTVMASLICRVCPTAKLFVIKLDEYINDGSVRQITAKSAAKAIRAAIDERVHIISMSWTIERTEQNSADIRDLEAAIGQAAEAEILMFCAANDNRGGPDESFPAACSSTKKIFKIGAAEATGKAWKWVGDADFYFPGHKVVKERPNDAPVDKCLTLSGSSVATAIGSGLAALILYCVQLSAAQTQIQQHHVKGEQPMQTDHFEGLQRHDRMREAFLTIGTTPNNSNKYIEVWNVFEKAVEKSKGKTPDEYLDIVREVATRLKTRKVLE